MAVVLTMDWFMDRCRTSINVLGDSVVAAMVETKIYGLDPAVAPGSTAVGAQDGPLRDTVDLDRFAQQNAAGSTSKEPLNQSRGMRSDELARETLVNGLPAKP